MNRTGIEWTDFTWSPVTGCLRGCPYCYARRIAKRFPAKFPRGFEPHFRKERLGRPGKRHKPAKIFVCSMADLFGPWVPEMWIRRVIRVAEQCPQHTFQFLTKFPARLSRFRWPENAWVGTTVTDIFSSASAAKAMGDVRAVVRYLSAEPILGLPQLWREWTPDWVIIGRMTGPGAEPPAGHAVENLTADANRYGIPVFHKNNLGPQFTRREWPQ